MKVKPEDQSYFESREKKAKIIVEELKEEGFNALKKYEVLEVGCNHGFITYHLSQLTKWKLKGGDISDNVFKYKKKFSKHIDINHLDATKMKYKSNSFDIIILNHVIEHVPEWENCVKEIYRVLKKGGLLYLATPNKYRKIPHPKDEFGVTWRVLFRNKSKIGREERMRYHSGFSAKELEELLSKFKEVKCLNKSHLIKNVPKCMKKMLLALPESFYKKRSQTCLFVARK